MGELFDTYAEEYERALGRGLRITGESREYFASRRVRWLRRCLDDLHGRGEIRCILDYGCGTGTTVPFLREVARDARIVGLDVSTRSLAVAEHTVGAPCVRFSTVAEHIPAGDCALAYCNGTFHHIQHGERARAARHVYDMLMPGGLFSFWENNPWNPATRWVMSRIPFDRGAAMLSAPQARRLLRGVGFEIVRTDYLFICPRALRAVRWLETPLSVFPLGAQYQVLCRKAEEA